MQTKQTISLDISSSIPYASGAKTECILTETNISANSRNYHTSQAAIKTF